LNLKRSEVTAVRARADFCATCELPSAWVPGISLPLRGVKCQEKISTSAVVAVIDYRSRAWRRVVGMKRQLIRGIKSSRSSSSVEELRGIFRGLRRRFLFDT